MTGGISNYISGKVQDKGHEVRIDDGNDGPFGSQYYSINRPVTYFKPLKVFVAVPGQVMDSWWLEFPHT